MIPLLLLLAFCGCAAVEVVVKDADELRAALIEETVSAIHVTSSFGIVWAPTPVLRRHLSIIGTPGTILDLHGAQIRVARPGILAFSNIALGTNLTRGLGPVPQIIAVGGAVVYDQVVFVISGHGAELQQISFWSQHTQLRPYLHPVSHGSAARLQMGSVRAWRVDDVQQGQLQVHSSTLLQPGLLSSTAHKLELTQLTQTLQQLQAAATAAPAAVAGTAAPASGASASASSAAAAKAAAATHQLQMASRSLRLQEQHLANSVTSEMLLSSSRVQQRKLMASSANSSLVKVSSPEAAAYIALYNVTNAEAEHSYWLTRNNTFLLQLYPHEQCFEGFPGFLAKDITDFVRLIKDPAVTRIELKGDIVFTEELFPPDNANDKSKGINVSQTVDIRACTGDPQKPIIVDVNNLQQQIYVYGRMTWSGNIKFINSYPSQRRAFLFPLISILSVEKDGVIEFNDLEIQGNEPCPLFDPDDPFWDKYGRNALSSEFVPQPGDFVRFSDREVLLLEWKFNKTAWVLNSQGSSGVVKAVGDGYWRWVDVLVTWRPQPTGPKGAALALAIALPVVLGTLLLAGLGFGAWWWRKRRTNPTKQPSSKDLFADADSQSQNKMSGMLSGGSSTAAQRGATATFDSVGSKADASKASYGRQELIEEARRQMQGTAGRKDTSITLEGLLGEGTFGKVYRGHWQGTVVAVKTMLFPAAMSGKEKREKMAIMETAISSSLSHPNIVQMYTYVVKPLTGELAMQAMERGNAPGSLPPNPDASEPSSLMGDQSNEDHGWEVRLVLELCDRGSLKDLLNAGGLHNAQGKPDLVGIVATALDIARAMLHLHSENVIHSDLKARNVLLKSAGADARGFVAKVSDFGLSVRMDPTETHVSNVYQGTLTHMAPEVLMYGKISRASDVYAFGILLWELYTGQQAFKGTPRVLLGHEVTKMGRRPEFPRDCPFDYQLLACRCWESDPAIRPSFQQILADLQRMATKLQMAGCDSASSLPMPQYSSSLGHLTVPAAPTQPGPQQQHFTPSSAGGGPQPLSPPAVRLTPGAAAMGAAAGAGAMGLDPAKLHDWEPHTSLLDLNTDDNTKQASAVMSTTTMQHGCSSNSQGPGSLSWGTQSAGGLWLGGELAPSNVPSDVQLPVQSSPDLTAAVLGQAAAAAAAAHTQLQQQQQQGGATGAADMQWPGLSGSDAAASGAGTQQQQQQQQPAVAGPATAKNLLQLSQMQHHQHQHQWHSDIARPQDMQQPPPHPHHHHQQQPQQQQGLMVLGSMDGSSSAVEPGSSQASVYVLDQSSMSGTGLPLSAAASDSNVADGMAVSPASMPARNGHGMAPIVEEDAEQQPSTSSIK